LRNIGGEIKTLTESLPKISSGQAKFPLSTQMDAITKEWGASEDAAAKSTMEKDLATLKSAMDVDAQISALSDTRKGLIAQNLKDKHQLTGSILLGAGVSVSILGALNTYMRAGKLFPGPHLYAGMAITILWAVAASVTPAMQKGNEQARAAHIACNAVNVALFAWQVPTGLQIMAKVIEKTPW
jgi:hypothetical protein